MWPAEKRSSTITGHVSISSLLLPFPRSSHPDYCKRMVWARGLANIHEEIERRMGNYEEGALELWPESHNYRFQAAREASRALSGASWHNALIGGCLHFTLIGQFAHVLLDTPSAEEGGTWSDFTLSAKLAEVKVLVDVLYVAGWSFGMVTPILEGIRLKQALLFPTVLV
jgi:hypothetical protein